MTKDSKRHDKSVKCREGQIGHIKEWRGRQRARENLLVLGLVGGNELRAPTSCDWLDGLPYKACR